MWELYLSLLKQLARMEKQKELGEAVAEVQRRIDLLEEVLSWRLPEVEKGDIAIPRQYGFLVAKEFHDINPFEGHILWSS